jgi:asparagine synthase (glutamine-hydrolysing)
MARYLPREVIARHKQPYRAPDGEAFAGGKAQVLDFMDSAVVRDYGYFHSAKVELLVQKTLKGNALSQRDTMALVGVLTTQLWHHHFIAGFRKNFRGPGDEQPPNRHPEGTRDARHVH